MNADQTEKGFDQLARALQLKPDFYDALFASAFYLGESGASEDAISACNRLLALYPKDTASYVLRGQAYASLEQYDLAEADFRQALSLDNTDFRTYNELGQIFFLKDDFVQARENFQKSLQLKVNGFAYEYLAKMLHKEGKPDPAIRELDKWIALEPQNADALRLKAQYYVAANKDTEAIKIYTQLQKSNKLTEQDVLNWGLIYYYQKKYPQALTYFSILKKHEEPDLYYFKALSEYRIRKPTEALKSINKAIALIDADNEENASYFYDRSIIRQAVSQKTGKANSAVQDFLHAVYLVPEIVEQLDYNGDTLELLGNARQVLKGLYTSRQLDSARINGYQQRAEAFADRQLFVEALDEVEKSIKIDSLQAFSYHLRGSYRAGLEKFAPAIRDYEKALRLPGNLIKDQTFYMRGKAYADLEMYTKALEDFNQAIALNGKQAEYYYERAFVYADQGNFTPAIGDMTKAIELQPEEHEYRLSRAALFNETGQFDKSIQDCNQVLDLAPTHADALYYRGVAYEGLKNYALAIQDLTRATSLNPGMAEAKVALDQVMIKAGK
jgi:tetratricopeptide (TPR) repeat protein